LRPLRFCMLTTFYPPAGFGGDAVQVERLAHALADRGHEVTVVHSQEAYQTLAPGRAAQARLEHARVRVVPIDAGRGVLSPLATYLTGRPLLARRRIERALEGRFDVLHFHNPSLLGGPGLLAMGEGIKLYTAHEQWLVCPTHVLWKYQRRVCERPQCWRCTLTYRRPPQPWRSTGLLERSLGCLDALIVPSRSSARLHERFAPLVRIARVPHFVPNGSDPDESTAPPRRPYFLFVGRLESIKGVETLIRAFRRRRTEDLVIAGTGTLAPSLQRAAADLEHVRFVGWMQEKQLDELIRGCLSVIVPTLGHEAFGLVPVEAFARAKPAIVHGFGALAELAEESGGAIAYRSEAELDAAIARLADDEELRGELGRRGHAAYLERWTPEVHLRRYFALIGEVARERGDAELVAAADAAAGSAEVEVRR
jgi:glycosyltransferase involved in cell wall biosynthesis